MTMDTQPMVGVGVGVEAGPLETTHRMTASPWTLMRDAAGTPREIWAKVVRLVRALWCYVDTRDMRARLARLQELGYLEEVPNRTQLIVGSNDMLRFWIVPAAADYYESKRIDFRFHQVLRFLDEPASLVDPTGFMSTADNIIGHLMQVVHANPAYDLQLLESHEDGLEELERQVLQMIEGTHPRARSIGAIVEDPTYHERLLGYVREYMANRGAAAPVRENIESGGFAHIERTFGTLPAAMRYFCRLPSRPLAGLRHIFSVKAFPRAFGEDARA